MKTVLSLAAATALTAALATGAQAAEYKIQMLNTGAQGAMVFQPGFVKLKPGDSIRILPTDKGHGVDSIDTMLPPGVAPVHAGMDKEVVVKFAKPGLYGFKCNPHMGFGMTLLVQAGAPTNLAQIQAAVAKQPPLAKKRFMLALAQVK